MFLQIITVIVVITVIVIINYNYRSYVFYVYIICQILTTALQGRHHLSNFTDKGTEAPKDEIICPRLRNNVGYIY